MDHINMNIIEKYQFGKIIINGSSYYTDVIIFPDFVQDNWWREKGHFLDISDLESVIKYKPDVLIIGTGMYGLMNIENILIQKLNEHGIKNIIVEKTKEACEIYNKETSLKKVAALHLTC
jgi:hypothetical protein